MTNKINLVATAKDAASGPLAKIRSRADDLGNSADRTGGKMKGLGSSLANVGKVAVVGLVALGVAAVVGGKEILGLSSRLEQMAAKVQTVFGKDEAGDVKDWADEVSARMGLTSSAAQGLAANFGDLLIPMKFTREQARRMSTDVVGLSGALSEWTGGQRSAAEVSEILAKAMLGEREGLKQLGISILDADVKARLLAKGQDKLTGSALEQAKAIATQELIFEKSKDAQDAYAKSGDGLLGKQALLNAKLSQLGENIATRLTPVFHTVTRFLVDRVVPAVESIISQIQKWVRENQPLIAQITRFASGVLSTLVTAIGNVASWIGMLIEKITSNKDAMNILKGAVGFLADRFGNLTTVVGAVVGAVAGFIDKLTKNKPVVAVFRAVIDGVASAFGIVRNVIGGVIDKIASLIRWIKEAITWLSKLGVAKERVPGYDDPTNQYPGFAHGGPVMANRTVLVGERGPELFRPKTAGDIIPNHRLSTTTGTPVGGPGGALGAPVEIPIILDGREVARLISPHLYYLQQSQPNRG